MTILYVKGKKAVKFGGRAENGGKGVTKRLLPREILIIDPLCDRSIFRKINLQNLHVSTAIQ
jgi:hypothetical protein